MPTADWDTLEPTEGTPGNAFELGLDVFIGAGWFNIPDITALNPQPQAQTRNRSSYAAKGQPRPNTYARGMTLGVNVEVVRDEAGQYQDELQYLLDKAALLNDDNKIAVRWFDTLGADYAYEMTATIEHSRPSTGDTDAGWFGFTMTATSTPEKIENPVNDAAVPQVAGADRSAAAATETLLLTGVNFTGTTGVTIGGVAGTGLQVFDDRHLKFVVPAGSAGSAPIIVTNAAGASTALPYTRGA
jgi:hypothetical protein